MKNKDVMKKMSETLEYLRDCSELQKKRDREENGGLPPNHPLISLAEQQQEAVEFEDYEIENRQEPVGEVVQVENKGSKPKRAKKASVTKDDNSLIILHNRMIHEIDEQFELGKNGIVKLLALIEEKAPEFRNFRVSRAKIERLKRLIRAFLYALDDSKISEIKEL